MLRPEFRLLCAKAYRFKASSVRPFQWSAGRRNTAFAAPVAVEPELAQERSWQRVRERSDAVVGGDQRLQRRECGEAAEHRQPVAADVQRSEGSAAVQSSQTGQPAESPPHSSGFRQAFSFPAPW